MKNLYLLGACGSIGQQTLDIAKKFSQSFQVKGVSLGRDLALGQRIIDEFRPQIVCTRYKDDWQKLNSHGAIKCFGDEGLLQVSKFNKDDNGLLVNALVGSVGLMPTVEAIKNKRDVALANKETLVMAGDIIKTLLTEYKVNLYPIDSEHSAIWQCLNGENKKDVKRIIITASGGSLRDKKRLDLIDITPQQALNHPNWKMGSKITIDSATMMNKGFEVIEAHHLFNIPYEKIDTIMHRQSIVHSLVEYNDNSVKAVLGLQDMRIPILYALSYPEHKSFDAEQMDLVKISNLNFEELSWERFLCLAYAYEAGKKGGVYPAVLNAANEAAVNLFLQGKIKFLMIEEIIRKFLDIDYQMPDPSIEDIINLDKKIQKQILDSYGGTR